MDTSTKSTLKTWAQDDQPREKLLSKGKESLSNSELLAILLGSGSKNETAVELAKRILEQCENNLIELSKLSINDLKKFKGVGVVKAITIEAALELGRRRQLSDAKEFAKITCSRDSYNFFKSKMEDLKHEEAWIIYLDRGNKVISVENISKGGLHATIIDHKIIFKKAIELNSSNIILAHNHPSGVLTPSKQDIQMTKQIFQAGKIMDINLLDHLIISSTSYYSFADDNKIES